MKGVTPVILILGLIIIAAAIGILYGSITGFVAFGPYQSTDSGANISDSGGGLIVGDAVPRVTGGEPGAQQNETQTEAQKGTTQQNTTTNQTTQNLTPATQFSGGSFGGGGSSGGGGSASPACSPSWSCSAWSECASTGYVPGGSNETCNGFCVIPKYSNIKRSENESFDVFININTTYDVYAIEFELYFNTVQSRTCTDVNQCGTNAGKPSETQSCELLNASLNASYVSEGNFLKKDGAKTFPVHIINNTDAKIRFGDTRFGTTTGITGNGTVAVISFKALGLGSSNLRLENVKIVDPSLNDKNISAFNGIVNIAD